MKRFKESADDIGWDGWARVLRGDVGSIMRRRAEEGCGLSDVSVKPWLG